MPRLTTQNFFDHLDPVHTACGQSRWGFREITVNNGAKAYTYKMRYCLECAVTAGRRQQHKLMKDIFDTYGRRCVQCGYDVDVRALQIDHVNSGGALERKSKTRYRYYKDILSEYGSGKYQILCANCNTIKQWNEHEYANYRG